LNPRSNQEQLEDQKPKKSQEGYLEEGKTTRPTKGTKSGKTKERVRKSQKLPPEINPP
jgi:hypothetical protein